MEESISNVNGGIISHRDISEFFHAVTEAYADGTPWRDCSLTGADPCQYNGSVQVSYGMLGFVPPPAPKEGMWLSVIQGEYLARKIEGEIHLGELYSGAGMLPIKRVDPYSEKSIAQKPQPPQSGPAPEYITLSRDVEIRHGTNKIVIPKGSQLLVIGRTDRAVGVRFQGRVEIVPKSAVIEPK